MSQLSRARWGSSLGETVLALALLVSAGAVAVTLFHSALFLEMQMQRDFECARLARNHLLQIRHWLKEPVNFDNPASCPFTVMTHDGYTSRAVFEQVTRYSPNSSLERGFAVKRSLDRSFLLIELAAGGTGHTFTLTSLVGDPRRTLASSPVRLRALGGGTVPTLLARDERLELEVDLLDSSGQPIPDIFFEWSVRPIDGVMTLQSQTRDGHQSVVINRARHQDGTPIYTGGRCSVAAGTRYGGEDLWEATAPINLAN